MGPQDGRCRRNHGAMAATPRICLPLRNISKNSHLRISGVRYASDDARQRYAKSAFLRTSSLTCVKGAFAFAVRRWREGEKNLEDDEDGDEEENERSGPNYFQLKNQRLPVVDFDLD